MKQARTPAEGGGMTVYSMCFSTRKHTSWSRKKRIGIFPVSKRSGSFSKKAISC